MPTGNKGMINQLSKTKNVFQIYGPDTGALMGKSIRETPKKVNTRDLYQLPIDFTRKYEYITLAIDILFFDIISFLLIVSRDIHFYTVEKLTDRENSTIMECLKRAIFIIHMSFTFNIYWLMENFAT